MLSDPLFWLGIVSILLMVTFSVISTLSQDLLARNQTIEKQAECNKELQSIIPFDEQQNVLDVYWVLLRSVESRTDNKKNILDANDVTQAYNLLNKIKFTPHRPYWEKNGLV